MIKKRILLSAGLILAAATLHSFDFGGSIGTYTKLGTPALAGDDEFKNLSIKQEEILTGWLRHDFDSSMFITAEADLRFRTTIKNSMNASVSDNILIPDLKILRLVKKFDFNSSNLIINAGRIHFLDISGSILNQNADGVHLAYNQKHLKAKVYAHYTGLLNGQNVTILNEAGSDYLTKPKDSWYCAASYMNAGAQIEFPYLFANQTLSAEALFSLGLPGPNAGTENYKRFWGTLGLNGFILKNLCYISTVTIGSEMKDGISLLAKGSLTYLPDFKNMTASLFGTYASGDHLGLKPFKGFTSVTAVNSYFEPEYTGLVKTGANISIKPIESIFTAASLSAVFNCPDKDFEYDGFEAGLTGIFQIFSDLNINANLSQYFAKDKNKAKGTFTLSATLAF